MRYDNNKRFLKRVYKKYSHLDYLSIKKAIKLEKELELLKNSSNKKIKTNEYYKLKRRLLIEKNEIKSIIKINKESQPIFNSMAKTRIERDLFDVLNKNSIEIKKLDTLYNWRKLNLELILDKY